MESYPTSSLQEEIRKMAHGAVFSGYDHAYGFWNIPVAKESQAPSTMRSAVKGLLELDVLAMGYNSSPSIFSREVRTHVVDKLPAEIRRRTGQYADDIGHSSVGERRAAVQAELKAIEATLAAVQTAGFWLKLRKCKFAVREMLWCGFLRSEKGRLPDPERTRAFLEMGTPANKTELVRWLGVAGSLRAGVPYFSHLAAPLHKRTHRKEPRMAMTEEYERDLEALKEAIRSAPPLDEPMKGVPVEVEVDGSTIGYGAVLVQKGRVCAVASRPKNKAELGYGSFDNEWAAVVYGMEAFEFWIGGRDDVLVKSDLKGLTEGDLELHAHEDKTGRRVRWVERLLNFRYSLKWVPREQLTVADALAKSPAFRDHVLKLREEVEKEARDRVNEARAASARGQSFESAKRDLRRAERAGKRAREEEKQRARKEREKEAPKKKSATRAEAKRAIPAEKEGTVDERATSREKNGEEEVEARAHERQGDRGEVSTEEERERDVSVAQHVNGDASSQDGGEKKEAEGEAEGSEAASDRGGNGGCGEGAQRGGGTSNNYANEAYSRRSKRASREGP